MSATYSSAPDDHVLHEPLGRRRRPRVELVAYHHTRDGRGPKVFLYRVPDGRTLEIERGGDWVRRDAGGKRRW